MLVNEKWSALARLARAIARRGVLGIALAMPAVAAASDPAYLREMPATARVLADVRGKDPMETRARQVAAMQRLHSIVREMAGPRLVTAAFPGADEKPILAAYAAEANRLRNEGLATFAAGPASADSPRAKWMSSIARFERSAALNDELKQRYFSPDFQARHRAATAAFATQAAAGRASIDRGLRDLEEREDSVWDRMTQEERDSAISAGVFLCALLAFGALRELLRFGVTTSGTPALRTGFGRARLEWVTGVVSDYKAWEKTYSTLWEETRENGVKRRFWTSTTYRHEEFDLVHDGGRHHVHTSHMSRHEGGGEFDRQIGRPLTAVWATRRWRRTGRFVLFREPGADGDVRASGAAHDLSRLLAPRSWTVLPAVNLGFVVGGSTDMLLGPMVGSLLRGLMGGVAALVCWLVVYFAVWVVRERRFDRHELPKLRALVDGRPG